MSAPVTVNIVSRWNPQHVLFSTEVDANVPLIGRMKAAVKLAIVRGANLGGAYLGDANLRGANLRGANLLDADLRDANLRGADLGDATIRLSCGREVKLRAERAILQIGPIGSEGGTLILYRAEDGAVYAQRGCFGPAALSAFAEAVKESHGDSHHGRVYRAAIALAEVWADESILAAEGAA